MNVRSTPEIEPIPYIGNFRIKDIIAFKVRVISKAKFCIGGDKQVVFHDLHPKNMYASLRRLETIGIFISKSAAQKYIVDGADIPKAYLYGDIY